MGTFITSAKCTYSVAPAGNVFNYYVELHNTSPSPIDIYAFRFGSYYFVPHGNPFPLQDIVPISSPFGWTGPHVGTYELSWQTSFQGSAIASGYILPGQLGIFVFQSSTGNPPETMPFACAFYINPNIWYAYFDGPAQLIDRAASVPWVPPIYNPWWWIETHGGLVPPGPPPPWLQELLAGLALGGNARVSPQMRVGFLERALEQIPIATAAIKEEIRALQKEIERG